MSRKINYLHTLRVSCIAYIIQAIAVNYLPLLFLSFKNVYGISFEKISGIIIFVFVVQIIVDLLATKFADKIGYRKCTVAAHGFAAAGFLMLGFLPDIMDPFWGIVLSSAFYSFGSGLIEVVISPLVEYSPLDNKESRMSLLHSFFAWGTAIVIVVSTVFFNIFGLENFRILSMLWAIVPILNGVAFMFVPIVEPEKTEHTGSLKSVFSEKGIFVLILLMFAAGASEIAMGQWASAFAESGLKVDKTIGDLAGPCMFAVMMGVGRIMYSKLSSKFEIVKYMMVSAAVCVAAYLVAALCKNSVVALVGCGITGLSVGVFWPGTYSYAAKRCKGGTAMFGILAFAGDMGCTVGPAMVGVISAAYGDELKTGILIATIFPILMLAGCLYFLKEKKAKNKFIGNTGG